MARISETFTFGKIDGMTQTDMIRFIQQMYTQLAVAINSKPDVYQRTTDGLTSDTFLSNGDFNINTTTRKVEMLTQHINPTTVVWTTLS